MAVIKGRDGRVLLFAGRKALLTTGQTGGVATTSPTPVVTAITLSPATGTASSASGTVIGTLSATVTGGVLMSPAWTLTNTAGGDFQIVGGNQVAFLPSNVPAGSYTITAQVAASNLTTPFSHDLTVTIGAAQSSVTTTPSSPMSQAFTVTNWGSATSAGVFKRGVWFKKGDVPAGSMPALSSGTAQFYGLRRWKDGSLKMARLLLRDGTLGAGVTRSYTMTAATGSGTTAVTGNAGLVSALTGHDIKVSFTNVKTWDCSSSTGNYAALGSGTFTASLSTHAGTATRWTLLTTGPTADVWHGWGMATDNTGGAPDAHLKVNWYVTRWKNADGTTLAFQIGAVVALDWWSVANKYFLTYDASLADGAAAGASFTGVRHQYQSQVLLCVNDGGLNAGTAPWFGATQPTLHCSFDRDYAISTGLVPPLDTAKRPTPAPLYAYVPCGVVADTDQVAHPNSHRPAIDAAGGYQGRGVLPRFDADAFMAGTPQAYAVARLNALSGLGVPYHYRSNRMRTRPGESADIANTIMPALMAPKAASYSDFTAQGLPIAVNAYNGSGNNAQDTADGFTWQTGVTTYAAQGFPLRRSSNEPAGTMGPWQPSLDASHGVSYCYYMALISGDEWLMEAQLDLATNLVHQAIYGYHNYVVPFPADSDTNSGRAAWNPSCPTARWTGLMAQWQADAIRAMGWTQLIQGHAIGLVPADHVAHDYLQAAMTHQGDFIQTNLDYLPPDFAAAAFYSPNSQLGQQALFSPWMTGFVTVSAYAHYLINEDPRWKRLGDFAAAWSIKQAALGRWYAFDIYRTSHRVKCANWGAATNPETPIEMQGVIELSADLTASTGVFACNYAAVWSTGPNPPPLSNGDRLTFSVQRDGSADGVIPAGATDGQVCYVVNLVQGVLTGTFAPTSPVKFQVSATPGGAPLTWASDATNVSMTYLPQALTTYTTANAGAQDVTFPYMPSWGNYVPIHVSAIMMARQVGNTACTTAIRDGALAFSAPMDVNAGGYYSAFDMATTA